jgi:hypothetical protein
VATCDGYQGDKQNNWCKDTITSIQWGYSFRKFEHLFRLVGPVIFQRPVIPAMNSRVRAPAFHLAENVVVNAACASGSMTECAPAYRFSSTLQRERRRAFGIATIIEQLGAIFHGTDNIANGISRSLVTSSSSSA